MRHDRTWYASIGLATAIFLALSALALIIADGIAQKDRLESRNDVERTFSLLLAGLRDHRDFGETIESSAMLRDKVRGVGAYAADGTRLYDWGDVPATYPAATTAAAPRDSAVFEPEHLYADLPRRDAVALILSPFHAGPPPPHDHERAAEPRPAEASSAAASPAEPNPAADTRQSQPASSYFFFTTLRNAETIYLEARQPAYWSSRRAAEVLLPLVEAAIAALVLFVRLLIMRNAEYRRRLAEQRSLVVLGTAASTLAHEIKNPLLSIRLQTRILEKTCPAASARELGIINEEVERLSALSHRVGDYLRDPAGQPVVIDPRDIAAEVGRRLCGRDLLAPFEGVAPAVAFDPERFRSVLENLVRNALESGGSDDAVSIDIRPADGAVRVDVLDRGAGIAADVARKAFDPFFTTKSRGTGIGLAVCKRFVQAAGGTIGLEPRDGGGCVARITLPASGVQT